MNIFGGFFCALSYLGLTGPSPRQAKLLFLGLDNAGKSTLLLNLADGESSSVTPTIHHGSEELTIGNVVLTTLGGPQQGGQLWEDHIRSATAVVFMVDAQDPGRFAEAADKLHALLAMEELRGVPLVVLGNKVDHPEAGMLSLLLPERKPHSSLSANTGVPN
jgi:GTP-binding protein SAR1